MKKNNPIHDAIDESLSDVHFDAQDMRNVLRAVRSSERREAPAMQRKASSARKASVQKARRRRVQSAFPYALAACMLVLVIAPLSLLALRTQSGQSSRIKTIAAAPGESTDTPRDIVLHSSAPVSVQETAHPHTSPVAVQSWTQEEYRAISAARSCFEALCDVSVFTFEEYEITCEFTAAEGTMPDIYTVTMNSLYDNGCFFRVTVSAQNGEVLSHSAPRLATVPLFVNRQSDEVKAWFDQYGAYMFMWPMDQQVEFSRRYEGAMLRMPREGERDYAYIQSSAYVFAEKQLPDAQSIAVYPMLYSEKASADGKARYQVYCFADKDESGTLPDSCLLVTLLTDGTVESSQKIDTVGL